MPQVSIGCFRALEPLQMVFLYLEFLLIYLDKLSYSLSLI